MIEPLNPLEIRVVACLFEKERTTPEYYPLTRAALTAACNQKNNREPVMQVGEGLVQDALETLKDKHWVWEASVAGARVPKFRHRLPERVPLEERALAILGELMLRGPQTAAELRARAARLGPIASLEDAQQALTTLEQAAEGPYVVRLPRVPGQREARYAHLLGGPVDVAATAPGPAAVAPPPPAPTAPPDWEQRLAALEARVAALETKPQLVGTDPAQDHASAGLDEPPTSIKELPTD